MTQLKEDRAFKIGVKVRNLTKFRKNGKIAVTQKIRGYRANRSPNSNSPAPVYPEKASLIFVAESVFRSVIGQLQNET